MANLVDNFTGAAGNLSGHTADTGESWTPISGPASDWELSGFGSCFSGGTGGQITIYWSSWTPPSADYSVKLTFKYLTDAGQPGIEIRGNGSTATSGTAVTGYMIRYDSTVGTGVFQVWKNNTGPTLTQMGADIAHTHPVDGDTLRIDISGSSTTVIELFYNDVSIGSRSDSSSPFTAAGVVGTWGPGGGAAGTTVHFEKFEAGTFAGGATTFTLTGPSRGPQSAESSNFTVTPNGTTTATWTPDAASGCTFTPSTITLAGTTPKTFTVTKTTVGTVSINGTASGLTPPTSVSYSAVATTTGNFAYQDAVPSTSVTQQVFNADATAWNESSSAGTSSASGTGVVSAVVIPNDYLGYIQFSQGTAFAVDVLTPPAGTTGAQGGRIFTGM